MKSAQKYSVADTLADAIIAEDMGCLINLIRDGADVNSKSVEGWAPLHIAAQNFQKDAALSLLKAGADVDVKDDHGNTPLWKAVFESRGRGEIISLLVLHGADPDLKNNTGKSPRDLANSIANYDVKQFFK